MYWGLVDEVLQHVEDRRADYQLELIGRKKPPLRDPCCPGCFSKLTLPKAGGASQQSTYFSHLPGEGAGCRMSSSGDRYGDFAALSSPFSLDAGRMERGHKIRDEFMTMNKLELTFRFLIKNCGERDSFLNPYVLDFDKFKQALKLTYLSGVWYYSRMSPFKASMVCATFISFSESKSGFSRNLKWKIGKSKGESGSSDGLHNIRRVLVDSSGKIVGDAPKPGFGSSAINFDFKEFIRNLEPEKDHPQMDSFRLMAKEMIEEHSLGVFMGRNSKFSGINNVAIQDFQSEFDMR
nr:hypothetical protein [Pseudomonas sp. A46]